MAEDTTSPAGQLSPDGLWRWDGARWVPAQPASTGWRRPDWLRLDLEASAGKVAIAIIAAVAILGDQAWRSGGWGLGASLALAVSAAGLLACGRLTTRQSRALALLSVGFGAA